MFFDSCHSGGNQRDADPRRPDGERRAGAAGPAHAAHRRGVPEEARASRAHPASAGDRERGVFFGACQPDEVAWESDGQGDFTRIAVPLLRQALAGVDQPAVLRAGARRRSATSRRQTPVLVPPYLRRTACCCTAAPPERALPDPLPTRHPRCRDGPRPGDRQGPAQRGRPDRDLIDRGCCLTPDRAGAAATSPAPRRGSAGTTLRTVGPARAPRSRARRPRRSP